MLYVIIHFTRTHRGHSGAVGACLLLTVPIFATEETKFHKEQIDHDTAVDSYYV